jgi:hypothetical protein
MSGVAPIAVLWREVFNEFPSGPPRRIVSQWSRPSTSGYGHASLFASRSDAPLPTILKVPPGMPASMNIYGEMEIVVSNPQRTGYGYHSIFCTASNVDVSTRQAAVCQCASPSM